MDFSLSADSHMSLFLMCVPVPCLMRCFLLLKILIRLSKLCVQSKKCRHQHQRLLKNMGAHAVVLDLLQIPYEKVCRPAVCLQFAVV